MKGTVACAVLAMAAAVYVGGERLQPADPAAGTVGPGGTAEHYRLVSKKFDCDVTAGVPSGRGRRPLVIGAGCHGGAAVREARWWLDRADGTVAFVADKGRVVAEFAVADGAAYETYARDRPILTLLAGD